MKNAQGTGSKPKLLSMDEINQALEKTEWFVTIVKTGKFEELSVHDNEGEFVARFPRDTTPAALIAAKRLAEAQFALGKQVGRAALQGEFQTLMGCAVLMER